MTNEAERLLASAKGHIAKGEQFYRQAATEIVAAMKADTTLGFGGVAEKVGKSEITDADLEAWIGEPS